MRPGDVVTLIRDPQSFTAFGATGRNALVPFDAQGITLQEALAKSGGLLDAQADPQGVFLMRPEPVAIARQIAPAYPVAPGAATINVVYRINMRDANTYFLARDLAIRNKDIVYVASASSTELQKFLGLVSSTLAPAGSAAGVYCAASISC